jgi:hypothetical protein
LRSVRALALFLLAAPLDAEAQGAGMFPVKGLSESDADTIVPGKVHEHAGPGKRLQRQPVPAQRPEDRRQARDRTDISKQPAHAKMIRSGKPNSMKRRRQPPIGTCSARAIRHG